MEHLGTDGWVFIAIADPLTEYAKALANVIATADFYQHGIPTAKDFEHAIRDLIAAGLVTAEGVSLALTERGQSVWSQIRADGPVHRHFVLARLALQGIGCVAGGRAGRLISAYGRMPSPLFTPVRPGSEEAA